MLDAEREKEDFQVSIQYSYNIADFCDVYAQSLVYALLLSRLAKAGDFDEMKLDYLSLKCLTNTDYRLNF
jgi:hypothetical protein